MDFMKIWNSLLAAGGNLNGAGGNAMLPTTYFMQGVHVFACANNDATPTSPTAAAFSSSTHSSSSSTSSVSGESIDERPAYEEDTDDEDEKGAQHERKTNGLHRRRIQRIRYSREEYKCRSCAYTCTTERAFFKHLRCDCGHNDGARLSCPICGKDRSSEQLILAHMTKHKDGKHFCCDLCKFRTLQLKKLIQHRRMHTGEKPHLCPFCTYRSARRDNLRSHVRRVHKKENLTCDTFTPRTMVLTPTTPTMLMPSAGDNESDDNDADEGDSANIDGDKLLPQLKQNS